MEPVAHTLPPAALPYVAPDPRERAVPLAVILSGLPGLGQIYVGHTTRGFTHILVVGSLISVLNAGAGALEPLFGLFLAFYWIFNMVDAGRCAQALNLALRGTPGAALPQERGLGTVAAGIGLMGLGGFTLAHNLLGFSLAWMGRWWPLGLVLLGGALVWRAVAGRMKAEETPE